ncbi:ATP-binding protein [Paenibacillus sp. GCM10012307]|uniref:histidine kinase n=1 Tax=Paenibacillus roseus TaxID=2798579 RepID=A0A934MT83_9BACL|nr:ATP-binding protein [Paenibacillus roseus]MBJ6363984.1 two-component sensor histidine kinase [Paenibacillus roseus]
MCFKQIFQLPISLAVSLGVGIVLANQFILYILDSTWQIALWGFCLSSGLVVIGIMHHIYGKRLSEFNEAEQHAIHENNRKLQGRLEETEKLTLAGTLAAGIAHEIRNPLTSLKGFIQLGRGKNPQYTDLMLTEIDRINGIVSELLELAVPKPTTLERVRLDSLLNNVVLLLNAQANLYNVELKIGQEVEDDVFVVQGEENKLKQVFINLIKNAIESMDDGGGIDIHLTSSNQWAKVQITDQGGGIRTEMLERLGEPFYTTKEQGTGLGIMICNRIVSEHKGVLDFQNNGQGGTTVTVKLPIFLR